MRTLLHWQEIEPNQSTLTGRQVAWLLLDAHLQLRPCGVRQELERLPFV